MDTMLLVLTVVSLAVAAVSTTVAWKVTRAERRRHAARVAALSAAAGLADVAPSPLEPEPARAAAVDTPRSSPVVPGGVALGERFLAADTAGSGSVGRQHWLMAGATFVAVLVATASIVSLAGSRGARASGGQATPLELVALSHQRTDGGVLTVSGLVRNPVSGGRLDKLEAEVRVFDPAGILIATRSALVDYLELAPGQESPFVVALGEATTAARYRVSFRAAGSMRPHVDQRTNLPATVDRTAKAR
jgi:hypothetical protein